MAGWFGSQPPLRPHARVANPNPNARPAHSASAVAFSSSPSFSSAGPPHTAISPVRTALARPAATLPRSSLAVPPLGWLPAVSVLLLGEEGTPVRLSFLRARPVADVPYPDPSGLPSSRSPSEPPPTRCRPRPVQAVAADAQGRICRLFLPTHLDMGGLGWSPARLPRPLPCCCCPSPACSPRAWCFGRSPARVC